MKLIVRSLLMQAVEELVGSPIPDLEVGFPVSRLSLRTWRWRQQYAARVAERIPEIEAEASRQAQELLWAHRKLAAAMLRTLRGAAGMDRLAQALDNFHLPRELRTWGRKQQDRLHMLGRKADGFAVAFLVLSLESAIEFEREQAPEYEPQDALSVVQRDYVRRRTLDKDFDAKKEGAVMERRTIRRRPGGLTSVLRPAVNLE